MTLSSTIARTRCGYVSAYCAPSRVPYELPWNEIVDSPSARRTASTSRTVCQVSMWSYSGPVCSRQSVASCRL